MLEKFNSSLLFFYRPKRSCGQGNIFAPVCHSVHRGVFATVHAGIPPPAPWEQTPPQEQTPPSGADTPLRSIHPPGAETPQEQTPPRSRHPPGADTPQSRHPPVSRHPPGSRYPLGTDTPPGSRLWHTVNERPVRILLECILVYFYEWFNHRRNYLWERNWLFSS